MGEIADMMLEGAMCQECGEFIENAMGFPGLCPGCAARARKRENATKKKPPQKQNAKRK